MLRFRSCEGFSDRLVCRLIERWKMCLFSSSSSLDVLFDRSSAHWLYVCFIIFSSSSLSSTVYRCTESRMCSSILNETSLGWCLRISKGVCSEREGGIHFDVESGRINFISWGIYDWPRCWSRQSDDIRSTFFDVTHPAHETKTFIVREWSIRFVIGKQHQIQRVRLPRLTLRSIDENDEIDPAICSIEKLNLSLLSQWKHRPNLVHRAISVEFSLSGHIVWFVSMRYRKISMLEERRSLVTRSMQVFVKNWYLWEQILHSSGTVGSIQDLSTAFDSACSIT